VPGIYLHIPFCKQACTYCDFHFSTTFEVYRPKMIQAICKEITLSKNYFSEDDKITTLYFGGGTPSILNESELLQIMKTLNNTFDLSEVEEITLEANPDDIDQEKLEIWKKVGLNRLSIGIQSFRQSDLDWMNRAHTVQEAETVIELAQQNGFLNITADLIYGLPDLSIETWRSHIMRLVEMKIPHISAYCLTVEPKTVLNKLVKTHKISLPNDEIQAEQFECLIKTLEEQGYEQYEVSNFSLPNHHSKHNSNYWKNKKYLGIGPSAHSYNLHNRSWNIANNNLYINNLENNKPYSEIEELTKKNQFNEMIMMGLRTKWGVDLKALQLIQEPTKEFWNTIEKFVISKEMKHSDNSLILTKKGLLKADYIASELFFFID